MHWFWSKHNHHPDEISWGSVINDLESDQGQLPARVASELIHEFQPGEVGGMAL